MHASIWLRSKWRSIAVALVTVVILTVTTAGIALAQGHVANDGQTLEMQSPEVQAIYASVWGDNAAMQWAADHNAATGQVAPQAQHPRYDEVFHVAYTRSMDMELAGRITADVIARGTIDQFMAGMDMGVLYGYVAPAPQPQPRAAPSGGGSSTSSTSSTPSTPSTPTTGTGLFAGVTIPDIDWVRGGTAPTIPVLPVATVTYAGGYEDAVYELSDLPVPMRCDACTANDDARQIEGTPRDLGSYPMTWTATQTHAGEDANTTEDDLVVSSSLMFTIHVLSESRPLSTPMFADETLSYTFFGNVYVQILLPAASGGVGDLTYTAPEEGTSGLMFDADRREIYGTIMASSTFTYTVTDMNTPDAGTDTLMVTITWTADTTPTLTTPDNMTVVVGQAFASMQLPEATGDDLNEPLEYSVSGLPAGLSMNSARQIVGTPSASNLVDMDDTEDFMVTYKVVDNDGGEVTAMFNITVNESP